MVTRFSIDIYLPTAGFARTLVAGSGVESSSGKIPKNNSLTSLAKSKTYTDTSGTQNHALFHGYLNIYHIQARSKIHLDLVDSNNKKTTDNTSILRCEVTWHNKRNRRRASNGFSEFEDAWFGFQVEYTT